MSTKVIEAVLRLSSKLGSMAGFRKLSTELANVDRKTKAFNRSQGIMAKANRELYASALRYAAPAVLAYGAVKATKSFATLERRLTRIGINADASKDQMEKAMAGMRDIANDIGAPIDNVVTGLESLIASGKSLEEALSILPAVARTAHAADAEFDDMATTADALSGSFGIVAENMENAFDILAKGGKAGKFELKDMASELPSLAPAFAALGYSGEEGLKKLTAALQIVRKETGLSGEAATAFMDVITKMGSETISNNFKKRFGMDIRKEMEKAKVAGEDTLEAFIRLSKEAVKGDLSKLPQLFTDKQMLIGMRALINRTEEMRDMFTELGTSAGAVRGDLKKLAEDAQSDFDKLGNSWDRLKTSIGKGLVDAGAADAMGGIANNLEKGSAIRKSLEGRGMGYLERENWLFRNTFDDKAKSSEAWRGGYRTDSDRKNISAYGEYGASRADAPEVARRPAGQMPLPTWRPDLGAGTAPAISMPTSAPAMPRRAARAPMAAGASPREAERQSMAALRSNPNEIAAAIDDALASGSQRAATKLAEGGGQAGDKMGDAAAAKLRAVASEAGAVFGEAAAVKIRAASAAATANVRNYGRDVSSTGDL